VIALFELIISQGCECAAENVFYGKNIECWDQWCKQGVSLNEEPAKQNRHVALRALCPNSLFSKVVFS
jgi:hypothetical protein